MKMKMLLLTFAATIVGLFASVSSAFACGILANQDECPSEFIR